MENFRNLSLLLVILWCFGGFFTVMGQSEDLAIEEQDLSQINWDEEEPSPPELEEGALSDINWDEEEPATEEEGPLSDINWDEEAEDTASEEAGGLSDINWDEGAEDTSFGEETTTVKETVEPPPLELTDEEKDPLYHWKGGGLFLVYLFGSFFTAHFTRKRAITQKVAPEFMIILHMFWPLEWLLIPFFKAPSANAD